MKEFKIACGFCFLTRLIECPIILEDARLLHCSQAKRTGWPGPPVSCPPPLYKWYRKSQKCRHTDSSRTSLSLWWHMFVQKNLFLTIFIFGLRKLLPDERMHLFQQWKLFREGKKKKNPSVAGKKRNFKQYLSIQVEWDGMIFFLSKNEDINRKLTHQQENFSLIRKFREWCPSFQPFSSIFLCDHGFFRASEYT